MINLLTCIMEDPTIVFGVNPERSHLMITAYYLYIYIYIETTYTSHEQKREVCQVAAGKRKSCMICETRTNPQFSPPLGWS